MINLIQLKYILYITWWEYISHYGRGGDLTSLNEEIRFSVAYSWHESLLAWTVSSVLTPMRPFGMNVVSI